MEGRPHPGETGGECGGGAGGGGLRAGGLGEVEYVDVAHAVLGQGAGGGETEAAAAAGYYTWGGVLVEGFEGEERIG